MLDFNKYFLPQSRVYLDNVNYETVKLDGKPGEIKLNCKDTIVAQLMDKAVKITFNRALVFEPEGLFTLSVTFGVILPFNPETKDEVDWKVIDIAGEFREGCKPLLTTLMSRTSLLIAEITSSSGQNPLVTPASPAIKV